MAFSTVIPPSSLTPLITESMLYWALTIEAFLDVAIFWSCPFSSPHLSRGQIKAFGYPCSTHSRSISPFFETVLLAGFDAQPLNRTTPITRTNADTLHRTFLHDFLLRIDFTSAAIIILFYTLRYHKNRQCDKKHTHCDFHRHNIVLKEPLERQSSHAEIIHTEDNY